MFVRSELSLRLLLRFLTYVLIYSFFISSSDISFSFILSSVWYRSICYYIESLFKENFVSSLSFIFSTCSSFWETYLFSLRIASNSFNLFSSFSIYSSCISCKINISFGMTSLTILCRFYSEIFTVLVVFSVISDILLPFRGLFLAFKLLSYLLIESSDSLESS